MITEQNAHYLLGNLYNRMDAANQNGLHGLLLVVEMVVRDRPKLLKCVGCVEGEECILESYLLAQHLCKKELSSRFVANLWIYLLKFSEKCFCPLKNPDTLLFIHSIIIYYYYILYIIPFAGKTCVGLRTACI